MVYKRYIRRGGKLHGPYYYESYRDKNGRVVSRYLKDYNNNSTIKKIFLYSFIFLFLLIFLFIIGNIKSYSDNNISGRVISLDNSEIDQINEITYDENLVSNDDFKIASQINDDAITSDVDLNKE